MIVVKRAPQLLTLLGAVLLWEGIVRLLHPAWLPPATAVGAAWWQLAASGQLSEIANSARTLVMGLAIVFVVGAILAISVGRSGVLREALTPYFNAALAIPTIALIPAFILIWGLSDVTRVATVVSFALVPLVVQWAVVSRDPPTDLLEMARSFDATRVRRLIAIVLPVSAPVIITGVRIAVVQGIKGVVSAEILAGVIGTGKLLQTAMVTFDLPRLYAVILTLLVVTFVVYLALERLERRASRRFARE